MLPTGVGFEELLTLENNPNVVPVFVTYPLVRFRFLKKLWLDHIYTPWLCWREGASLLFMGANFAALFATANIPQIVLQHNSLYLQDENIFRSVSKLAAFRFRLEKMLFFLCAKKQPRWVVQLESTKVRLASALGVLPGEIKLVTMPPLRQFRCPDRESSAAKAALSAMSDLGVMKILFPAKAHPNKNHNLIPALIDSFSSRGVPVCVFVTLEEDSPVLLELHNKLSEDNLVNLGYCPATIMGAIYMASDLLFFPTSAESYGLPLVEAIMAGIPAIALDVDFAHEISGDTAFYFELARPETLDRAVDEYLALLRNGGLQSRLEKKQGKYSGDWGDLVKEILAPTIFGEESVSSII
jgi:glycosyltransferase involved in cell wall biosynthesis